MLLNLSAFVVSFVGLAAAWPLQFPAGCGKPLPSGEVQGQYYNHTIVSNGLTRSYLVFIPPWYTPYRQSPLIVSYHGGLRTALQQLQLDLFTSPYFNNESMVIYPQGINDSWEGVPGDTVNDVLFTEQILDDIEATYCVDLTRYGATGKSDGAGFVGQVAACDPVLSKRFSAVAPVSGAFYVKNTTTCSPATEPIPCNNSRAVPMFEFHGGNDTTISYNGGYRKTECLPTIPHWITSWAVRDNLSPVNTSTPLSADATLYSWGRGFLQGFVKQATEFNIGHDWPSTQPNADNQVAGHHVASYNATPLILEFFSDHPLTWGDWQ